jgi:hypothetical protein
MQQIWDYLFAAPSASDIVPLTILFVVSVIGGVLFFGCILNLMRTSGRSDRLSFFVPRVRASERTLTEWTRLCRSSST